MRAVSLLLLGIVGGCGPRMERYDLDGDGFPDCEAAVDHKWPQYSNPFDCEMPAQGTCDSAGLCVFDYPYGNYDPLIHDCDDANPDVHPGAEDVCDDGNVDDDCDGFADGADPDNIDMDCDRDGFSMHPSDPGAPADCDDNDANRTPGVAEICDEIDNDCDGSVDEDIDGCEPPINAFAIPGDPGCQCASSGSSSSASTFSFALALFIRKRRTARS
jgi:hypothetical protein